MLNPISLLGIHLPQLFILRCQPLQFFVIGRHDTSASIAPASRRRFRFHRREDVSKGQEHFGSFASDGVGDVIVGFGEFDVSEAGLELDEGGFFGGGGGC